jgi:transposase
MPSACGWRVFPGLGPITASAIAATITNPSVFRSGRELAAWIGLVSRQHSTGANRGLGILNRPGFAGGWLVLSHAAKAISCNWA